MRRCLNCTSERLEWDSYAVTTIPPTGARIPAPKLMLCCVDCSEIVESATLDEVAEFLNKGKTLTLAS